MTTELPTDWAAAMPDVLARLEGIRHPRVAAVGCGRGCSALAIASTFLDAHVDGLDPGAASIAAARVRAADAGLDGRVRFIRGDAAQLRAHGPYDLVLLLDGLSELADPVGALRAARAALAAGGTVLVLGELVAGTVRDLAAAAGYARAGALALDDDVARLYRLVP
jgi:ubiquinone/menaquinone biosynthesis C-methylase UbiE